MKWRSSLILAALAGCSSPPAPTPDVARPIKTWVVTAGEEVQMRTFPGKVEAARRVELAFQVSGLLVKLPIKEGQKVAKGELLAQIRPDEFEARLKTLQGQLDSARASLRALQAGERPEEQLRRETQVRATEAKIANTRAELDRSQRLVQSRTISQAQFELAETAYRVAQEEHKAARQLLEMGTIGREEDIEAQQAAVRALEGRVVEANIQLQDTSLKAPYDGVIAQRFVEENQNVRAKEPVVRFQDVNEIDVTIDVPETVMVTDLRSADILHMVAELSGAAGLEFPVQIREMAQTADPTTQTFRVRTAMKAPEGIQVLPGMTATVRATYRRADVLGNRILAPVSAVQMQDTGEQVAWVLGPDMTVTRRTVKIGAVTGGDVEIVQGLNPGERIAVAGVSLLREGMKVRDLGDALGGGRS